MAKRKGKTTREEKSAVEQQETLPETGAAPAGTDAMGKARREEPGPAGGAGQGDPAAHGQAGDTPAQQGADGAGQGDLIDGGSNEVEANATGGGGGTSETGSGQPADAAGSETDGPVSDDHEADDAGKGDGSGNFGEISDAVILPDGSGFFTASFPLPEDHWIYAKPGDGYLVPPMPFRMGVADPRRIDFSERIVAAGRYAVKAATSNGKEDDFDPDALVQNLVVGMVGYHSADGMSEDDWANPSPIPPIYDRPEDPTPIDAGDGSTGIPDAEVPYAPEPDADPDNPFSGYSSSAPAADGYTDGSVYTASCAAFAVLDHIGELHELPDGVPQRCDLLALGDDPEPANALAKYIRTIGRDRATPAVLGQQLKILGLVDNGELHPVEELIAKTFATTLCDLDDFDRQVADWIEAAGKTAPPPVPVPIEDTTLEPVDDAFEATI